jgi:membrane dipeptidase
MASEDVPPADKFPIDPGISCSAASDQPPPEFRIQLTPEQEKRAVSLYQRSIVITAHDHCVTEDDFLDAARAGITARVIKPIVDGHYRVGGTRYAIEAEVAGWEQRGRAAIAMMQKRADDSRGKVCIIRNVSDIERVKRDGAQGIIISFEGGRPLQGRLEMLAVFYGLGLRELQLHWAVPSPLKNRDGTLSPFAEDVIREMDRLGIVLDLSHMPERTFGRALELTRNPVVISHCGVSFAEKSDRPGTDHLDDATIRRIASTGGVMCIHFYEGYIHPRHGAKYPTVADLVDHMDQIKQVAGASYIGLGPDYSPMKGWRWVEGAERFEGMPNVVREMVRRSYTDKEIEGVLGLNLLRVYRQVWKQ